MSVPDTAQILALLDRLDSCIADDLESQFLDFKPWQGPKDDLKLACEYACCFANGGGGVRSQDFIDVSEAARVLQTSREDARRVLDGMSLPALALIERRGHTASATFHLAKGIAKELKGKAAYTKTRGLNPVRYAEMVREYLRDHQTIRNRELRELLGLGDSPSAQVEASRHFKKWSEAEGFLDQHGNGNSKFYTLRKAS